MAVIPFRSSPCAVVDQPERGVHDSRITPCALGVQQLIEGEVVQIERQQQADDFGRRRHSPVGGGREDRGRQIRRRRTRTRAETSCRQPPVVGVPVCRHDGAVGGVGGGTVAEALVRSRGPVHVSGTIVGSGERRRGSFELPDGLLVPAVLVVPPSCFPRRALCVPSLRERRQDLAKQGVGAVVLVDDDQAAGQGVQRVLGPGAVRELIHEFTRQPLAFVLSAQPAECAQVDRTALRRGVTRS